MLHATFGQSPVSGQAIVEALTGMRVFIAPPRSRPAMKEVKARMKHELPRVLAELGAAHQLQPVYEKHPAEFLFDFVWLDTSGKMVLAAECEDSMYVEDVLYDFRKLLHAKAPLKLLLFTDSGQLERQNMIEKIGGELARYGGHVAGEEYLLVQFCRFRTGLLEAFRVCPAEGCTPQPFYTHRWPERALWAGC